MASNINPNNIDGTYPVAGQDNDSQGFRTNFANIRTNFDKTKTELEDLQSKVIVKSALTGITLDNDMAGTVLSGAQLKDTRETLVSIGTAGGDQELSHRTAHNHTISTNASVVLNFAGFPAAGTVGRMRFEIQVNDVAHTLKLPVSVTKGTGSISGLTSSNNTITFSETGTYHFEFWTDDGGTNVHIEDKSRNNANAVSKTPTGVGAVGDRPGDLAFDTSYIYVCTGEYDGSTVIWKKSALSAI
jgi:hypothetical protein